MSSAFDAWKDSVGDGWKPMVHALLVYADKHGFRVDQVKEKFGSLRFYWGVADGVKLDDDRIEFFKNMVEGAEALTYIMCEDCGGPGINGQHGSSWWLTLCPICSEKRRARIRSEKRAEDEAQD